MKFNKIWAVYFSPCGSTKRVTEEIAQSISQRLNLPVQVFDYTLPMKRDKTYAFSSTDIVIWGTPVYAGRVPNKLRPFMETAFAGNGAQSVPLAVFGNRNFDDALFELQDILNKNGFSVVAGAGIVAQHVFSDVIAKGRPDDIDKKHIDAFIEKLIETFLDENKKREPVIIPRKNNPINYYTPTGIGGEPTNFLKAIPITDESQCTRCGICASKCPMGSINKENPAEITGICIKCHACVNGCVEGAKSFEDTAFLSHKQMLEENYTGRTKSQFFI